MENIQEKDELEIFDKLKIGLASDEKIREYMKRLLMSRLRILVNNGFYGLLLMHMIFSIDENCSTAATDGRRIYFGPAFLDDLSDSDVNHNTVGTC